MGNRSSSYPARLSACLIILSLSPCAFAQSNEKPKLKDFGSSLKRIIWDADKKAAVEIKATANSKTASDGVDIVRVETSLVTSDVLVLDAHGNPVSGLTDKDFLVTEDGTPQHVGMLSPGDNADVPRSIVLIMDYSGSLAPYINMSVEAAKTLVDQLGPRDRMAVVTDDVKLLADFTQDRQELKSKLESLKKKSKDKDARGGWFHGHSLQFSALMATLREMFDSEDQRPVIIFQTDGDELRLLQPPDAALKNIARSFSINDVYKTVEKSGVTIYTVIPGLKLLGLSEAEQNEQTRRVAEQTVATRTGRQLPEFWRLRMSEIVAEQRRVIVAQQSALAVVSTISGGWASFLENPSQANDIYSRIFSDINRRYIVGYYPTNKEHDGQRRKLSVTVRNHPDYIVMGRKAYYAPGPDQ